MFPEAVVLCHMLRSASAGVHDQTLHLGEDRADGSVLPGQHIQILGSIVFDDLTELLHPWKKKNPEMAVMNLLLVDTMLIQWSFNHSHTSSPGNWLHLSGDGNLKRLAISMACNLASISLSFL